MKTCCIGHAEFDHSPDGVQSDRGGNLGRHRRAGQELDPTTGALIDHQQHAVRGSARVVPVTGAEGWPFAACRNYVWAEGRRRDNPDG